MLRISHIANRFKIGDSDLQKIGKQPAALRLDGAWSSFFPTLGQSNLATSATNKQVIGHVGVPMGFISTINMGVSKFRDTPTAGS